MRAFKAHLRGLSPYPYKKEEAPVKLDQNESPFDLPGELKEEALGRLRAIPWNRYPEIHAASRLSPQRSRSPREPVRAL